MSAILGLDEIGQLDQLGEFFFSNFFHELRFIAWIKQLIESVLCKIADNHGILVQEVLRQILRKISSFLW